MKKVLVIVQMFLIFGVISAKDESAIKIKAQVLPAVDGPIVFRSEEFKSDFELKKPPIQDNVHESADDTDESEDDESLESDEDSFEIEQRNIIDPPPRCKPCYQLDPMGKCRRIVNCEAL